MLWNPCGQVVDFLRDGYEVDVRPYRNSDKVVRIRWYPVPDNAPVLPYTSALNSLYGQEQRLWTEDPLHGEEPGTQKIVPPDAPPAVPVGGHVCGTEQDFAEGGIYDPAAIPPPVDRFGIPMCCSPVAIPLGGVVCSGQPFSEYTNSTPGTTCLLAPLISAPWSYAEENVPSGIYPRWWVKIACSPFQQMHARLNANSFESGVIVYVGPDCANLTYVTVATQNGTCVSWTAGELPFVWLVLSVLSFSTFDYDFQVDYGPCP